MAEHENIIQTIKSTIQDVVAPDVRELKVRDDARKEQIAGSEARLKEQIASLDRRMDDRFSGFESLLDAHLKTVLAAVTQSRAENELMVFRHLAALSDRVSAIESRLH